MQGAECMDVINPKVDGIQVLAGQLHLTKQYNFHQGPLGRPSLPRK